MKQGLIICSGGISTTMIARKLNEFSEPEIHFEARGVMTDTSWLDYLDDYSLILISPQIKHMFNKIAEDVDNRVKMLQIPSEKFNTNLISEFWKEVKKEEQA